MNKIDIEKKLNVKRNQAYSWGATSNDKIVLFCWDFHKERMEGKIAYLVSEYDPDDSQKWQEKQRLEHIEQAKNGTPCFLAIGKAKDKHAEQIEAEGYKSFVFKVDKFISKVEHSFMRTYAIVSERVEI